MVWHVHSPFYFKENRDEKPLTENISFQSLKFHKMRLEMWQYHGLPYFVNGDVLYTACAIFIYVGNNAPQLCLKFGVGLFNMGVEVMSFLAVQSKRQWVVFKNKAVYEWNISLNYTILYNIHHKTAYYPICLTI